VCTLLQVRGLVLLPVLPLAVLRACPLLRMRGARPRAPGAHGAGLEEVDPSKEPAHCIGLYILRHFHHPDNTLCVRKFKQWILTASTLGDVKHYVGVHTTVAAIHSLPRSNPCCRQSAACSSDRLCWRKPDIASPLAPCPCSCEHVAFRELRYLGCAVKKHASLSPTAPPRHHT
jgi:hypothetical protein